MDSFGRRPLRDNKKPPEIKPEETKLPDKPPPLPPPTKGPKISRGTDPGVALAMQIAPMVSLADGILLSFDVPLAKEALKQMKARKKELDPDVLEKTFGEKGKAMYESLDLRIILFDAVLNLLAARKEIISRESQLGLLNENQWDLAKKLGFK